MPLDLPRFCPILDRSVRLDLSMPEMAKILANAGVHLVQLRSKQAVSRELCCDARQLISDLPPSCSVVVNDRADVAVLAGAAGIHLGQDDLPVTLVRELLGNGKVIGLSTHNRKQIEAAEAQPVDYIAIGPVFATSTKPDTEPAVGLEGLQSLCRQTTRPVMAIGGITVANAAAVIEAGADSVAVISAWLTAEDIPARLQEFCHALGRLD